MVPQNGLFTERENLISKSLFSLLLSSQLIAFMARKQHKVVQKAHKALVDRTDRLISVFFFNLFHQLCQQTDSVGGCKM